MVQYPGVAKGLYVASSSGLYDSCNVFLGCSIQLLCQKNDVCFHFVFYYHHIDGVFVIVLCQSDAWLSTTYL
jgi:hypothetical protein